MQSDTQPGTQLGIQRATYLAMRMTHDASNGKTRLHVARSVLLPAALLGGTALLSGCSAVLFNPAGDMAVRQRNLIYLSTGLMLLIIIPVIVLTLLFAWRYRASANNPKYNPEWDHSTVLELLIWSAPLLIIIALGAVTWVSTHQLDPYRNLTRIDAERDVPIDTQPLRVEVVAMDWKWLFIYPDLGIATVNEMAAVVDHPIRFEITATSVMNAFFVPSLAGMVYAMPGMETKLHAVINRPGEYQGMSGNYSGEGFSHMRFKFHGLDQAGFDRWVAEVKAQGTPLSRDAYLELAKPSAREPVRRYAGVEKGLFDTILNRCAEPGKPCMSATMAQDALRQRIAAGGGDPLALVCTATNPAGLTATSPTDRPPASPAPRGADPSRSSGTRDTPATRPSAALPAPLSAITPARGGPPLADAYASTGPALR